MQRRIISILLVLALAMLLVAGCRSNGKNGDDTPPVVEDTTLEGTWRVTEIVGDEQSMIFPTTLINEEAGAEVQAQLYIQLKDGTVKYFNEYSYEEKTWVVLTNEEKYTVDKDTITIFYEEDEGSDEEDEKKWTYAISGKTLYVNMEDTSFTAVKVDDSVVADPVSYEEYCEELRAIVPDTTLEGTWGYVMQLIDDEEIYHPVPAESILEDFPPGFMLQIYFQLEEETVKLFVGFSSAEESVVTLIQTVENAIEGDTNTISLPVDGVPQPWAYEIIGNIIKLDLVNPEPGKPSHITAIKVDDSVVKDAINFEDFLEGITGGGDAP